MKCQKCGAENSENSVFCAQCGKALYTESPPSTITVNSISTQPPPPQAAPPVSQPEPPEPKVAKPKMKGKVAFFFSAIFLLVLTIYNFSSNNDLSAVLCLIILIFSSVIYSHLDKYFKERNSFENQCLNKEQTINNLHDDINNTQEKLRKLQASFTPEMKEHDTAVAELKKVSNEIIASKKEVDRLKDEIKKKNRELIEAEKKYIQMDEKIQMQEFGLYTPKYDFASSEKYKERLNAIREKQKQLIKTDQACTGTALTYNNSIAQGKKVVNDYKKLLLRAFNSECDELIDKVKFNTFDTAEKRMKNSRDTISRLGSMMSISITTPYFNAKYEELCLAFEYRQKKQEEKEEQKEIRARMREEAKLAKEIEEARRKVEKEQIHYRKALEAIEKQLTTANEAEIQGLNDKKHQIIAQLGEIDKTIKDIDYREANIKAGYVYVISNIGSFGENVYKIGMTRRLEPMERIDELGGASVPFKFDVHAMIFSDNAPALEAALHRAFENKKLNMVNRRREFFNVTLDEIEEVVKKNYDKTVEFIRLPEAEQYRESLKMKAVSA